MKAELPIQAFTRKAVEALSWGKGEPSWMTEIRLDAWDRYALDPAPLLPGEPWASLQPASADASRAPVPSHEWPRDLQHTLDERGDEEGLIIFRDATVLSRSITKEQSKKGILFTDLDTALKAAPELVRRSFSQRAKPESPWAALHTAFWSGGTFLFAPAFVKVELPFHTCCWMSAPGTALFPHAVVWAEKGSLVSFLDEFLGAHWVSRGLAASAADITVGEDARVRYFCLQNWGRSIYHLGQETSQVHTRGHLLCLRASLGAQSDPVSVELETAAGMKKTLYQATAGPLRESDCRALEDEGFTRAEARYRVASRFFEPVLDRVPSEALREKLRHYIVGKVTGERPEVTLQRAAELHPEIRS